MATREERRIHSHKESEIPSGKNYLLVLGIDKYTNGVSPLHNAVRDAKAFKNCLINYFQFDENHCIELYNEQATRRTLIRAFKKLNSEITNQDNLVFYFSGHGTYSSAMSAGYWLLSDAESGYEDSYMHNQSIIDFISVCEARHIYGIVDSCFAGTIFRNDDEPPSRLYNSASRYILTSGRDEIVPDGIPGHHSPFAQTLLHELRNGGRLIWGEDLARNVLKKIKYVSDSQIPRGSHINNVGHFGGEFFFAKKEVSTHEDQLQINAKSTPLPISESIPVFNSSNPVDIDKKPFKTQLKGLFVKGSYEKGFKQLKSIVPTEDENTYYLLQSQYADFQSTKIKGTQSDEQLSVMKARLNNRILSFIDDL